VRSIRRRRADRTPPFPGDEAPTAPPEPPPPPSPFAAAVAAGIVTMGASSYGEPNVPFWTDRSGAPMGGKVIIGAYSSLADGVVVMTGGEHRTEWVTTSPLRVLWDLDGAYCDGHPASRGDVRIGNDVWVGREALILSGVTIGDGAVVGARAVVAGDVRPYAVVVGNPAREVRRRFDDATVEALLRVRWWEWPEELVRSELDLLLSAGVDRFVERHDPGKVG
jgi:acetyltransferase-like isoleucine patch superfamily enzyme